MSRVRLVITMDVDQTAFAAEYGEQRWKLQDVKKHLRADLLEALIAAPYADAIKNLNVD